MCADPQIRTRLLRELAGELAARRRDHAADAAPSGPIAHAWAMHRLPLGASAAALALLSALYF